MSGFSKRVALLEKWAPNLLPKVKDLDDLADIIYDTWLEAEADTEQRIIKLLEKKLFHTVYNDGEYPAVVNQQHFAGDLIGLIKGETNG